MNIPFRCVSGICFAVTLLIATALQSTAYAAPGSGVPFRQLQDQVDGIVEAISQNDKMVTVDCVNLSISDAVANPTPGGRLIIIIDGPPCSEDVIITRDDVTLEGNSGTVEGTINIVGARRVVIRNLTVTGPGAGVSGSENASFTLEDSTIDRNGAAGIEVLDGAHANIIHNTIINNGQAGLPDSGRGILVTDSASATVRNNTIEDNRSDGIGAFNGAYARVEGNVIQRNGRREVFEAGIQVSRAMVRANRNIIKDNGYAAIEVFNGGNYRTGTFLSLTDHPDNIGPFEVIEGVGPGKVAVDIGQASYVDLRQVNVRGTVFVGRQSMLQVRGDNVGLNHVCSTIDTAGGVFSVFGFNSGVRLRFVSVIGAVLPGLIEGLGACP